MINKKLYKLYSTSCLVEYYTDKIWSKKVYNSDEVLFRPDNTHKTIKNLKRLKLLFFVLKYLWFIILPVVSLFKCLSYCKKKTSKKNNIELDECAICVDLTIKAKSLFKKNCKYKNKLILQFPWVEVDATLGIASFEGITLLRKRELIKIWVESICYAYAFVKKNKNLGRFSFLQTYDSYNWFVAYYILLKLSLKSEVKLFLSNQMDRWALLVNNFAKKKPTHLIMHGVLGEFDFNRKYNFSKISSNFQSIYYYPTNLSLLQDNLKNKSLQYIQIQSNIELKHICHTEPTILWVGGPAAYHDKELAIYKQLNKDDLYIYYKPHPLSQNVGLKSVERIEFIDNKYFFPKVDSVISVYYSTVLDEYISAKVPCFRVDNESDLTDVYQLLLR